MKDVKTPFGQASGSPREDVAAQRLSVVGQRAVRRAGAPADDASRPGSAPPSAANLSPDDRASSYAQPVATDAKPGRCFLCGSANCGFMFWLRRQSASRGGNGRAVLRRTDP